MCITSGGEAVSFSKYRPNESRRSSEQSTSDRLTNLRKFEDVDKGENGNIGDADDLPDTNSNRQTFSVI